MTGRKGMRISLLPFFISTGNRSSLQRNFWLSIEDSHFRVPHGFLWACTLLKRSKIRRYLVVETARRYNHCWNGGQKQGQNINTSIHIRFHCGSLSTPKETAFILFTSLIWSEYSSLQKFIFRVFFLTRSWFLFNEFQCTGCNPRLRRIWYVYTL